MGTIRKSAIISIIISLLFASAAFADITVYVRSGGLTGGIADKTGTLDGINGINLVDGDICFVFSSNVFYIYRLDAESGADESSPSVIAPDSNAGDKRWLLQDFFPIKYSADDGDRKATFANNTSASPTASTDELYFEGNKFKINENGTEYDSAKIIASGTAELGTAEIASGNHATVVTVAATGVATTDVIDWGFNADVHGVTGYAPTANGCLFIQAYPTANNVNFLVINNTAAAITPGSAVTLNWKVSRK